MQALDDLVADNRLWQWLLAAALFVGVYAGLGLLKGLARRHLAQLAGRFDSSVAQLVADMVGRRTSPLVLLVVAAYAGSQALEIPHAVAGALRAATVAVLLLQAALWANGIIDHWVLRSLEERAREEPEAASVISLVSLGSRLVLWGLVLLVVLHNAGVDITALVAGLGVAGIAVALAVQNILSDLFASLSIILDKPFVVGDFVVVGDYMGTVERIGLKTTRVRSLSGEQLIFSNTDLLNSRIRNYKRMQERRVLFTIGVTYQTPYEKLAAIPSIIREVVEAQENTRFDRAHFARYGDFALVFEVVYFVTVPDYNVYMDIQQSINLALYRRFAAEGIQFALPTQTIYLAREPELAGSAARA